MRSTLHLEHVGGRMKLKALTSSRPAGIAAGAATLLLALSAAVALAISGGPDSSLRRADGSLSANRNAFRDALAINAGATDAEAAAGQPGAGVQGAGGAVSAEELDETAAAGGAAGATSVALASGGADALYRENLRAAGSSGGSGAAIGMAVGGISTAALLAATRESRGRALPTVVSAAAVSSPTDPLGSRPIIERAPPPASARPPVQTPSASPAPGPIPSAPSPSSSPAPAAGAPALPAPAAAAPALPQPSTTGLVDGGAPATPTNPLAPRTAPGTAPGNGGNPATPPAAGQLPPAAVAAPMLVTPEPGTFALLGGGLLALGAFGLRKRRRNGG